MEAAKYGEKYKLTKVCIDSYDGGVLDGRIYQYNPQFEEGISFRNTMAFLKCMELINENAAFGEYEAKRTFQKIEKPETERPLSSAVKQGKMATFVVKVHFQQHTSWQGTVLWCDKKKEERFRSAIELLMLMDSAMEKK